MIGGHPTTARSASRVSAPVGTPIAFKCRISIAPDRRGLIQAPSGPPQPYVRHSGMRTAVRVAAAPAVLVPVRKEH